MMSSMDIAMDKLPVLVTYCSTKELREKSSAFNLLLHFRLKTAIKTTIKIYKTFRTGLSGIR